MFTFIIALLFSFNTFAKEPFLVIKTNPQRSSFRVPGDVITATFSISRQEDNSNKFLIYISYSDITGPSSHLIYNVTIPDTSLIERDNELFIVYRGQEYLLAHHKWYYYPYWQTVSSKIVFRSNFDKISRNYFNISPEILFYE